MTKLVVVFPNCLSAPNKRVQTNYSENPNCTYSSLGRLRMDGKPDVNIDIDAFRNRCPVTSKMNPNGVRRSVMEWSTAECHGMEYGGVSRNGVRRSVMEWSAAECHGMECGGVSRNGVRRSVTE